MGYEGVFRQVCEDTLRSVRENQEAYMTVLDIFLKSPVRGSRPCKILDRAPSEQKKIESDSAGAVEIIHMKLQGREFGTNSTVKEQVDQLIRIATDPLNLCQMYPLWLPWC
jgi:phosphatidylinositol kinase/protein kinase (PI-3  family)